MSIIIQQERAAVTTKWKRGTKHCVPTAKVLLNKAIHSISKPPWPYLNHSHFSFLHNYDLGKFNGIELFEIKMLVKFKGKSGSSLNIYVFKMYFY